MTVGCAAPFVDRISTIPDLARGQKSGLHDEDPGGVRIFWARP